MAGKTKTVAQRAKEAGVSVATMRNRMREAGAMDTTKEVSREAKLAAEIRKLTLEADAKQRMLEILDADFLPNEIVEEQQRKIAFVINAFTRAAISELPPLVAGLTPAKVERVIADWVGPWVARLKDESDAVWTEAEKAIARELRGDLKKVAASQSKKPRKKKEPKQL